MRRFARIDDPGFVVLARRTRLQLAARDKIWPDSYAHFVAAHAALVAHFGIDTTDGVGITPASHRTGGATFYFIAGVPLDVIRWHGRWQAARSLEIYIQEASASTFLHDLTAHQLDSLNAFSSAAPILLDELCSSATQASLGKSTSHCSGL